MKIVLCTLVLNEMQWLPKLYEQHKNWPGMVSWAFVESADQTYASTNPEMVTADGLSTDGTTDYLTRLAAIDPRVTHIKHGFCSSGDPAQAKCEARNCYLDAMEEIRPKFFVVLDADEFYPSVFQSEINHLISIKLGNGYAFTHREIWHPPYLQKQSAFQLGLEVVGGFWSIPYCRVWRWYPGLRYLNHNTPSLNGNPLDARINRMLGPTFPYMVHMGFASSLVYRAAKNRYYEARGEAVDAKRSWYCDSRRCFEIWEPDTVLPRGAEVTPYNGFIPECFQ